MKLPKRPILKETKFAQNDLRDQFALTFSVKGITLIEPIMASDSFAKQMNLKPQLRRYDSKPEESIATVLTDYQNTLTEGVVNGFRIEDVAVNLFAGGQKAAKTMLEAIRKSGPSSQSELESTI